MSLRGFRAFAACSLAAACCFLAVLSCDRSPTAPYGRLQVYVSVNGDGPAPGKKIEVRGTSLSDSTDVNGQVLFTLRPGTYVVRAYEIGTPGPVRLYVEQSVQVQPARTSLAKFIDCRTCFE